MIAGRAALLTPPGAAGIATIGVRAADYAAIQDGLFRPYHPTPQGRPQLGEITENGRRIDEVIVSPSVHAEGFEIHCHGGVRIVQRILLLLQEHGLEISSWETFYTPTSIEQEVEVTLPLMLTPEAVKCIAIQAEAGLTSWIKDKKQAFQHEHAVVPEIAEQASALRGTYELSQRFKKPPLVVVAGPANAGKSTLVNALTGRTQSVVADLPGTTRDWTEQLANVAGLAVRLIDTAGRRADAHKLEQAALINVSSLVDQADLVTLLEPADSMANLQRTVEPWLVHGGIPVETSVLRVVSKCDLLDNPQKQDTKTFAPAHSENPPIHISALHRQGLDDLRGTITRHFDFDKDELTGPLAFTQRQVDLLDRLSQASDAETMMALLEALLDSRQTDDRQRAGDGVG